MESELPSTRVVEIMSKIYKIPHTGGKTLFGGVNIGKSILV